MHCQFCGAAIRGSKYGCKKCKPKIVNVEFEVFDSPTTPAKQIAVVISVNGKEYAGYLPLSMVKSTESIKSTESTESTQSTYTNGIR